MYNGRATLPIDDFRRSQKAPKNSIALYQMLSEKKKKKKNIKKEKKKKEAQL